MIHQNHRKKVSSPSFFFFFFSTPYFLILLFLLPYPEKKRCGCLCVHTRGLVYTFIDSVGRSFFLFSSLSQSKYHGYIYIYLPDMFRVYTCVCDSIVELDALAQSIMKQKGATWQIVVEPGFPKKGIDIGETHARSFENIFIFFTW